MIKDEIIELLYERTNGMKAREIARRLGYERSEVNSCLYRNKDDIFFVDDEYYWYLDDDYEVEEEEKNDEYDDEVLSKLNNSKRAEWYSLEDFNKLADWSLCLSPGETGTELYYKTKGGNIINCDSKIELALWEYLEENDLIIAGGGQKLKIEYRSKFRDGLSYYPDMVVLTKYNHIAIIEVKPATAMDNHSNMEKYKALKEYCKRNGYEYMMIDPGYEFMTFDDLLDYFVLNEISDIFKEHDGDYCYQFDNDDVDEWYNIFGEGIPKKEFALMFHSCVASFGWFNKYKNGFKVSNIPN